MPYPALRNVALIAHVDHGKTTLVDAMLHAAGVFADHERPVDRVMDSNDQERERGITILAKAASIEWKGTKINLVDTPGHADFGGEVERALMLVDGVLLLVDAAEGPMPQTRYVLSKALEQHLPAVVVVNKVDRSDARTSAVVDEIYELFFDLDAEDHHIEFPIVSAIARDGIAVEGIGVPDASSTLAPVLDAIVDTIPAPVGDPTAPLQALVTNLDASDYLGRLAMGRVVRGTMKAGERVTLIQDADKPPITRKIGSLMGFSNLGRDEVEERQAGDLFVVSGFPEVGIGDTFSDTEIVEPLERLKVDEPVLKMTFGVSTSPLAGTEGKFVTSRQIRDRLEKEVLGNVSIRIADTSTPEIIEVAGAIEQRFIEEREILGDGAGGEIAGSGAATEGAKGQSTVDDAVAFLARLSGGGMASFEASRLATGYHNANRFEIHGENGALRFDFERMNELGFYDATGDGRTAGWTTIDVTRGGDGHPYADAWWPDSHGLGYEHGFVNQAADILTMIGGGTPVVPMPDFADALATQRVLHAAIESARNHAPVTI